MRSTIPKLLIATCALCISTAYANNVNVGVTVSGQVQPGVYGRIDIGHAPPPPIVYAQPILIAPPARQVYVEPLYLHVPPGHARNWNKFCYRYDACGRPVYFVRTEEFDHDRHYAHHDHDHDYDRYRYVEREEHHDHGRGHDHDDHDDHDDRGGHGKHKGHRDRDD